MSRVKVMQPVARKRTNVDPSFTDLRQNTPVENEAGEAWQLLSKWGLEGYVKPIVDLWRQQVKLGMNTHASTS